MVTVATVAMEPFSPSASSTKPTQPTSHKKSAKGGPSPLQIHDRDTEQGTPENQLSPTFNTETSTTDSGVSNASSLTSDCPTHEALPIPSHALVTPTLGSFETLVVPGNGTHCLGLDMCNTEDATITGWVKEGCPDRNDGKREDGCPSKCVGNMTGTDSSFHSTNSGLTTGDHPGNSVDEQITTLSSPTSHTHTTQVVPSVKPVAVDVPLPWTVSNLLLLHAPPRTTLTSLHRRFRKNCWRGCRC